MATNANGQSRYHGWNQGLHRNRNQSSSQSICSATARGCIQARQAAHSTPTSSKSMPNTVAKLIAGWAATPPTTIAERSTVSQLALNNVIRLVKLLKVCQPCQNGA